MAGQVIGAVGSENEGPDRARGGRGLDPRRHRRRTPHRQGRARRTDPARNGQRSQGRQRHPADARPGDRDEDRAGAGRSRRNLRAEGGDGDRRRPAQLADPGDGQLAAGRPRRPLLGEPRRPAQPGDRLHLRAGLDLQGVHGLGGARGKRSDAGHDLHPAAPAPGRRPHDRRRRAAGDRHPHASPKSSRTPRTSAR